MAKLNAKMVSLPKSKIRDVFNMVEGKEGLAKFVLGEPNFDTAQEICDYAYKAMSEGHTHYTNNRGLIELREEIAKKLEKDNHVSYDPKTEIIVTTSGTDALNLTMRALCEEGDEVIVPGPYWTPYPYIVQLAGAKPVVVPMLEEDGFMYNLENLKKAVNEKTKVLMLNSPSNPTGGMADRKLLEGIAELARKYDFWILSDEVYEKIVFDGNEHISIASLPGMKERTIINNSFSKSYAMTGWRIGYAAAPAPVVDVMTNLHEYYTSCTAEPAQYGAIAALRIGQKSLDYMIENYTRRRKILVEGLNNIKGLSCMPPKGTFYAFPNIKKSGMSSDTFYKRLIDEAGVVVIPGDACGEYGEGYVRMCFATSDENIQQGLSQVQICV